MTRNIKFIVVLIFGIFIFFILLKGLKNPNQYFPEDKGKIDLNLKFNTLNSDEEFSIGDLIQEDSYILINIWSSWCLPCREEHNYLMNIKNNKINIVGINYKDKKYNAKKFIDDLGNPYSKILIDNDGTKSIELGAIGVPETYLFQKSSKKIIKRYIGPLNKIKTNEIKKIIYNE